MERTTSDQRRSRAKFRRRSLSKDVSHRENVGKEGVVTRDYAAKRTGGRSERLTSSQGAAVALATIATNA